MEKLHLTRKMGMVLLAMVMLWPVACKRDQLPPGNSLLNTYRGTDKMVLKVIETLREPANQTVLADLEMQGNINWEYETLITSRFLKGYTLRFATGSDGNYLDAEVNAETGAIKLFSKQMQQQRDALSKQNLNSQLLKQGNGTLSHDCTYTVFFEIAWERGRNELWTGEIMLRYLWGIISERGFKIIERDGWGITFTSNNEGATASIIQKLNSGVVDLQRFVGEYDGKISIKTLEVTNSCDGETGDNPNLPTVVSIQQVMHRGGIGANQYGATVLEDLEIVVGCYKENGVWIGMVKQIKGFYSVQARLLPGVTEITGPWGGNTNATNFCKQVEDMKNLGEKNASWYMIRAVQAHENVHVATLLPCLHKGLPNIKDMIQSITVPSNYSYRDALAQIKSMALTSDLKGWGKYFWGTYTKEQADIDHDSNQACEIAERNIVDPIIAGLCSFSRTQMPAWPSCTFCPL